MSNEIMIKTVKLPNMEMDYFSFGAGERAFVIIPGLSVRSVMLSAPAVAAAYRIFAEQYTVYVFDRRKNISKGYDISDMADDTASAMQALGIKNADIFGASQGGMIAQLIAVRYPELVNSLVLGSTLSKLNPVSEKILSRWCELAECGDICALNRDIAGKIYSERFLEQFRIAFTAAENEGTEEEINRFLILADACRGLDIFDSLDNIRCPVLVIGSWNDRVLSGEASVEIAKKLRCPLIMYSDYGHAVYDEAPDYKAYLLKFFLENRKSLKTKITV